MKAISIKELNKIIHNVKTPTSGNLIIKTLKLLNNRCDNPKELIKIPLDWFPIILPFITSMILTDDIIKFTKIRERFGGLEIRAIVTPQKFSKIRKLVLLASNAVDTYLQKNIKNTQTT